MEPRAVSSFYNSDFSFVTFGSYRPPHYLADKRTALRGNPAIVLDAGVPAARTLHEPALVEKVRVDAVLAFEACQSAPRRSTRQILGAGEEELRGLAVLIRGLAHHDEVLCDEFR